MIKVTVHLSNDFDSKYDDVIITKEDILQLAANKAKGNYVDNYWNRFIPNDEIIIESKI